MSSNNPYIVEVIESHELIQQWFANTAVEADVCTRLLSHFSPSFTMVGVSGHALNYPTLCAFFQANGGAKQGLKIEVSAIKIISEWENGAVISYQEQQSLPEQAASLRYSTVVFEKDLQGKVLWRHLHETKANSGT